jgi:branched-chain amino acid transport system substrate-binding protein
MLGRTAFAAGGFRYAEPDRSSWPEGYRTWVEAVEAEAGHDTGTNTGVSILRAIPQAADCVKAFANAAEAAQSLDREKLAEAMETLSIPASETPSGCAIVPGEEHRFYDKDCTRVFKWVQSDGKWVTEDVTPED